MKKNILFFHRDPMFPTKYLLIINADSYYVIADCKCEGHKAITKKYKIPEKDISGGGTIQVSPIACGEGKLEVSFQGTSVVYGTAFHEKAKEVAGKEAFEILKQNKRYGKNLIP